MGIQRHTTGVYGTPLLWPLWTPNGPSPVSRRHRPNIPEGRSQRPCKIVLKYFKML